MRSAREDEVGIWREARQAAHGEEPEGTRREQCAPAHHECPCGVRHAKEDHRMLVGQREADRARAGARARQRGPRVEAYEEKEQQRIARGVRVKCEGEV